MSLLHVTRHFQTGTAHDDDPHSLPPTHRLRDLSFHSTTVPDPAPTDLPTPRKPAATTRPASAEPARTCPSTRVPACGAEPAAGCRQCWEGIVGLQTPPLGSRSGPRRSQKETPGAPCPCSPHTDVRADGWDPAAPTPLPAAGTLGGATDTHRGPEGAGEGAGQQAEQGGRRRARRAHGPP